MSAVQVRACPVCRAPDQFAGPEKERGNSSIKKVLVTHDLLGDYLGAYDMARNNVSKQNH